MFSGASAPSVSGVSASSAINASVSETVRSERRSKASSSESSIVSTFMVPNAHLMVCREEGRCLSDVKISEVVSKFLCLATVRVLLVGGVTREILRLDTPRTGNLDDDRGT